jgi:hypothetical protein
MTDDWNEGEYFIYKGEEIDDIPRDVTHVIIHPSVRAIRGSAFKCCSNLSIVNFGEGLEEIGEKAFEGCSSIQAVFIPAAVKAIMRGAFFQCHQLTAVVFGERLEEIGVANFWDAYRYLP